MRQPVQFMALGGAQEIGASCYYVEFAGKKILFDCGTGTTGGHPFIPDLYHLCSTQLEHLNDLDCIVVSHAHTDHAGALLYLMENARDVPVFMTEGTRQLCLLQAENQFCESSDSNQLEQAESCLSRITPVSFLQELYLDSVRLRFFQAGHIPGAMMTEISDGTTTLLYTGDYSLDDSPLCPGCIIPDDCHPDILLMCAVHARHPGYQRNDSTMKQLARRCLNLTENLGTYAVMTTQLTKGVEFLKQVEDLNKDRSAPVDLWIDDKMNRAVSTMERLATILDVPEVHLLRPFDNVYDLQGLILCADKSIYRSLHGIQKTAVDFTLHEDFEEMESLLLNLNAQEVIVVHAPKTTDDCFTIEQQLFLNPECISQFIFPEKNELIQLQTKTNVMKLPERKRQL